MRNESDFFRQAFESINQVFWICSTDWKKFYYVNQAYKTVWAKDVSELYDNPSSWLESVYHADSANVKNAVAESSAIGVTFEFPDFRIIIPVGEVKWISMNITPVYSGENEKLLSYHRFSFIISLNSFSVSIFKPSSTAVSYFEPGFPPATT